MNPIHIVFDNLPGSDSPRLIEVEDGNGNSISVGEWREREDGTAELVIPVAQEREAVGVDGELDEGINYAIDRLCEILEVDPKSINWDAATETMDGDVRSVICNVLVAAYGEEWSTKPETTAAIRSALVSPPVEAKPDVREEEDRIDALRLTAFRTNDPADRQAYFDAVSKWFQHRHYRRIALSTLEPTAPQEESWPIETDDQVEALAKECGINNRRYMTPADYSVWCERQRKFARLASLPAAASGVSEEMVERACRAHAPQWERIDPEIQSYARDQMRAALNAALNLGREG